MGRRRSLSVNAKPTNSISNYKSLKASEENKTKEYNLLHARAVEISQRLKDKKKAEFADIVEFAVTREHLPDPKKAVKNKIGRMDDFNLNNLIQCAPIYVYAEQLIGYNLRKFPSDYGDRHHAESCFAPSGEPTTPMGKVTSTPNLNLDQTASPRSVADMQIEEANEE